MDYVDSRPPQYVHVRDPVLQPQLQYPSETDEVEVAGLLRLLLVHHPSPRFIQQIRRHDCFVHIEFDVAVETVSIPNCVLKTTEGLTGLGNPVAHFVVDFGFARKGAAQGEVVSGGDEEANVPLHVPFRGGVEGRVIGEQKFVDGGCGYTRLDVHPPVVE
ncbi:hypothetical protein SprV_0501909100 [Sparganum proliferum]